MVDGIDGDERRFEMRNIHVHVVLSVLFAFACGGQTTMALLGRGPHMVFVLLAIGAGCAAIASAVQVIRAR